MYRSVYNSTIETKLRSFQVKPNLRAIVTNEAVHGFSLSDTDKYSFSKIEPKPLQHLFCECRITLVIWNDVTEWISLTLRISLSFRPCEILFVVEGENNQAELINCLSFYIRFYTNKSRILGSLPTTNEALLIF